MGWKVMAEIDPLPLYEEEQFVSSSFLLAKTVEAIMKAKDGNVRNGRRSTCRSTRDVTRDSSSSARGRGEGSG